MLSREIYISELHRNKRLREEYHYILCFLKNSIFNVYLRLSSTKLCSVRVYAATVTNGSRAHLI